MNKNLILIVFLIFCTNCAKPTVVEIAQKTDYKLSCEDLKFAILETIKFKEDAEEQRDGTGANVTRTILFWPAMLKSMINSDEAVQAANDRIYHLEVIQLRKKCPTASNQKDKKDDIVTQVRELKKLRDAGAITQEEYEKGKNKIFK